MTIKKIIIGLFFLSLLNSCGQNMVLLGPAYTLGSTGNVYQAGLTFGSDKVITKLTGKSTSENIKQLLITDKQDAEFPNEQDTEFFKLVKKNIEQTRKKLNLTNP